MIRLSTSCASGSGAVMRSIGSCGKNMQPSGMAWTSPVKRSCLTSVVKLSLNFPLADSHASSASEKCSEAQEIEHLFQARGNEKIALRWQSAHEKLEHGGLTHAATKIDVQHGELIKISQ